MMTGRKSDSPSPREASKQRPITNNPDSTNDGDAGKTPVRVGLVLEGGGAKGAYSFGCLQAFASAGLRFDAIAGTSVGALNAAIFAAGHMKFGEEYWKGISHGKVYRPRLRGILCLPLLLLRLGLWKAGNVVGIRGTKSGTVVRYILAGSVFMILFSLVCWGLGVIFSWEWGLRWRYGVILHSAIPAVLLAVMFGPGWLDGLGVALLLPAPLRREVARIAADLDANKTPVYVTLCEHKELVDPDHVSCTVETTGGDEPAKQRAELPYYVRVNELPPDDRTDAVMASAALPVGVFPPVQLNGLLYTDGGEVDNTPVYPLMSLIRCDVLVVVRLRPPAGLLPDDTDLGYAAHWSVCDRLMRLRDLSVSDAMGMVDAEYDGDLEKRRTAWWPPRLFRCREPEWTPRRIITIAPKESLGGFMSGTLNFSARKSQRLMLQGRRDALAAISDIRGASASSKE
jgi:hypothetical protein